MIIWRRWIFPLLMVVILGVCAVALAKIAFFPDEVVSTVSPEAALTEPVVVVERGSVVNALSLNGNVARDDAFAVRNEINGTVTAVHVGEGATVAAGQKIFTVRQDEPRKDIDVLAPEAGDVSELALVKGQSTAAGAESYRLTPARYHVLATVEPVQLYRLVDAPTEATVTITGGPAPFACTGVKVQVTAEGVASVRCAIPTDQTVFAGLPASMDIALGQVDDALIVPVTAVQGGAETGNVWVEASDGAEPEERAVTVGINDGVMVEVLEGLEEGDSIREFVPGFVAPVEENCYEVAPGVEECESGTNW